MNPLAFSNNRVIVIGASAGGVEALTRMVSQFPRDIAATIFVVLHIAPTAVSVLPNILSRRGRLAAHHAIDGETPETGRIYVAPPDRHLLVMRDKLLTPVGPRENGHRPAVDPLFRSAALAHGQRVIGVVLTGNLDDGTAGLQAIKQCGGIAIVQDPDDADYPGMPRSAVENVAVDHVLKLEDTVSKIMELLAQPTVSDGDRMMNGDLKAEVDISKLDVQELQADDHTGEPSGFSCPECAGVLWEIREGKLVRYRCRVGHAYSAETMLAAHGEAAEAALWAALRALEENAAFARRVSRRVESKHGKSSRKLLEQADRTEMHARKLREILLSGSAIARNPDPTAELGPTG
ncbi:MAG TPA: chemotaxis protein CheB [Gemmatimonadaceae bacterium]|nr:chemotaxis protein CheB [Gemmatimonadaceae bacterium]